MPVYNALYGLRASPFALTPDPEFFFLSRQHREALAGLAYAIVEGKGFAVLTGEVGTGKTTIIRTLLTHLGERVCSALIFNPTMTRLDLYRRLLAEFRLPPQRTIPSCTRALQRFLLKQFEAGVRVAVIIDEAHGLSGQLLEEIRLLSNFETTQSKLMQLLLVGQPELMERLAMRRMRPLRQRIGLYFELLPLQFADTVEYVRARLATAGATREIFHPRAYATLYRFSGGMPRLINALCDNALLSGFARETTTISGALVRQAAHDLRLRPLNRLGLLEWLRSRYRLPALASPVDLRSVLDLSRLELAE